MTAEFWVKNLAAWWIQAGAITAAAALLLRMMPIPSPRIALVFLQVLLGASLLLPALEPWRVAAVESGISTHALSRLRISTSGAVPSSASEALLAAVVIGAVARLVWIIIGYARLCWYRSHAVLLEIVPDPSVPGVRAQVYLSCQTSGPVTFGVRRPAVLLPAPWPNLDASSRNAILCHEFLHVRRKDWAFHVTEEIIRALLWFHPAVWWLISEIRLAREQVVDRMVVGITRAPRNYVEILLRSARINSRIPAPSFTHEGYLTRRIKSLCQEVSMTGFRLFVSLVLITLCVAGAGAVAMWAFPLQSVRSTFIASDAVAPSAGVVGGIIQGVVGGVAGGLRGGVPGGVAGGVISGVPGGMSEARTFAARPSAKKCSKRVTRA
jgi:D-alanyl-D-alanine endopeptidase (penicillin-binding protein 7)